MDNRATRLSNCFSAVFPALTPDEIARASAESVAGWDSLKNLMLLTMVEEEFGVGIAPEDYEELASYPAILEYLQKRQEA